MIQLRQITDGSVEFAYDCIKDLRGDAEYDLALFKEYIRSNCLSESPSVHMYIAYEELEPRGLLTVNKFAMPRYLGFGYELEEVIVSREFQGQGYGSQIIEAFLSSIVGDKNTRKVLVKTDDDALAGKFYQKYFDVVLTKVYSRFVHRI